MRGYRFAIQWIVENDDCSWLTSHRVKPLSITASMVADFYECEDIKVRRDLKAAYERWMNRFTTNKVA